MHLLRQSLIGNKLLLSSRNNDPRQSAIANNLHYEFGILSDKKNDYWKIPPLLSFVAANRYYFYLCSGLVCLRRSSFEDPESAGIILWNPATRKFRSINSQPFNNMGLGYVEATGDYKIVVWSDTHASVYSLNSDSWKNLDNDAKQFPIGRDVVHNPSFLNGRMHWMALTCTCCNVPKKCVNAAFSIVAFDVADEVVSCLGIPDNRLSSPDVLCQIQTLVFKGCLSVVIFSFTPISCLSITELEIWVMEEYDVQGSWFKQFTIQELPVPWSSIISWNDCEIVFTYENLEDEVYGDVIYVDSRERLMFYDPFSKEKYYLEFESLILFQVFNYVECLASVGAEQEIATMKLVEV